MNIDGTIYEMSPAWRALVRRWYRQARKQHSSDLGVAVARERVEKQVQALMGRAVRLGA